jgi:hypothetical protein
MPKGKHDPVSTGDPTVADSVGSAFKRIARGVVTAKEFVVDPVKASTDRREKKEAKASIQGVLDRGNMYRVQSGANPLSGAPGAGGYFVDSHSAVGGKTFIEVQGKDLKEIVWVTDLEGKEYVDVAGNPVVIVGPQEEIVAFLEEAADKYLANSSQYIDPTRWDNQQSPTGPSEFPIFVTVEPFTAMSPERRSKAYNTNFMIAKFALETVGRAAGAAGGAANPQSTPAIVSGLTTIADVGSSNEEFDGDDADAFVKLDLGISLFAMTFSAVAQGEGSRPVPTDMATAIKRLDSPARKSTGKPGPKFFKERLAGKLTGQQEQRLNAIDKHGWIGWLPNELQHRLPGWTETPGPDPDLITGVIDEIIEDFKVWEGVPPYRYGEGRVVPTKQYREWEGKNVTVTHPATYFRSPAVMIAKLVTELGGLFTAKAG